MEEKKDWILNNIHLKEGGLEDLLFEYADAVIEDYQGRIEDEETLTSVSVSKKIDEEVYNLIQAELDKAREEGYKKGTEDQQHLDGLFYGTTVATTTTLEEGWILKHKKKVEEELSNRLLILISSVVLISLLTTK